MIESILEVVAGKMDIGMDNLTRYAAKKQKRLMRGRYRDSDEENSDADSNGDDEIDSDDQERASEEETAIKLLNKKKARCAKETASTAPTDINKAVVEPVSTEAVISADKPGATSQDTHPPPVSRSLRMRANKN
jgi:hypothetical protein